MANTNEEFMKKIERDYPDVDWDNITDINLVPNIFKISGYEYVNGHRKKFEIYQEYKSKEEAEVVLDQMRQNPVWSKVIWDSVKIRETKPLAAVELSLTKELRADILEGKKVFPMYLP
jgi:hypothetical protein